MSKQIQQVVREVQGHLYVPEAIRLYEYAARTPKESGIIEIGHFQGRSTICLALGVQSGAGKVFTFDSHQSYTDSPVHLDSGGCGQEYGLEDAGLFLENIVAFGVAASVVPIMTDSGHVRYYCFLRQIHMAFIDGDHSVGKVLHDARNVHSKLEKEGILAMHDSEWPGPKAAIAYMQERYKYQFVEKVNSTTFLRKRG